MQYSGSITPIILEKFKEKKPVVRDPSSECIDAVYSTTVTLDFLLHLLFQNLDTIIDDVTNALGNKNPNIKIQTCLFLYRVFKKFNANTVPIKHAKTLSSLLVKVISHLLFFGILKHFQLVSESDPEVRDSACVSLGAIMKAVGKKAALPFLGNIASENLKMKKVSFFILEFQIVGYMPYKWEKNNFYVL